MTEAVHVAPKREDGERCPYCHAGFAESPSEPRVWCERCGTGHHAGCFSENEGCSIMGCGARNPESAVEPRTWGWYALFIGMFVLPATTLVLVGLGLAAFLWILGSRAEAVVLLAAMLAAPAALWGLYRYVRARQPATTADQPVGPAPPMTLGAPVTLPAPIGPPPDHCPACKRFLDAAPSGEKDDLRFCFHCGAALT